MDNTIIQQGRFTSDGTAKLISLRSDVDWMRVYNATVADDDTQTSAIGVEYYWQKGMASDRGFEYKKSDAANAAQLTTFLASGGFRYIDSSTQGPSAVVTGTTITKASPPVATAASHGFANGDLVLLDNLTEMPQLGVTLFTIGNVTTNTFELSYFNTNTANFTAETSFQVRSYPQFSFSNDINWISSITTGATTSVQLTADAPHLTYSVGSVLRFKVPSVFGMSQINGLTGEILSYTPATNTYVVDIDSTGFDAFAWPAASAVPMDVPLVYPIGTESQDPTDEINNLGAIQMKLYPGADGPAGQSSDVIYWVAGKSFSVTNE